LCELERGNSRTVAGKYNVELPSQNHLLAKIPKRHVRY
jgi:hypothetical protein